MTGPPRVSRTRAAACDLRPLLVTCKTRAAASDGGPREVAGAAASLTASSLVTRASSGYLGSGYSGRGVTPAMESPGAAGDSGHGEPLSGLRW